MKFIFSEYKADYSKYHFPYQVYLQKEASDDLDKIYSMGFLSSRITPDLFYLARSVRVDLSKFEPTSENRRIMRKTEYLSFKVVPLSSFKYDYSIGKLGKEFYKNKAKGLGTLAIKNLFEKSSLTHVIVGQDKRSNLSTIGYCPVLMTGEILHYAYPFYELKYIKEDLGLGMMLQVINYAKENGLKYVYLGTCYSESAFYKLQFTGTEYFTGFNWSSDTAGLKELVRSGISGHLVSTIKDKTEFFRSNGISL